MLMLCFFLFSDEPPPVPSGSLPKSGEIKTYEQPWGRADSKKKMNYADINFDGGPERGEINKSKKHPNYLENEDSESLRVNMGTRASGQYDNEGEGEFYMLSLYLILSFKSTVLVPTCNNNASSR